jgi:hypothetical protein
MLRRLGRPLRLIALVGMLVLLIGCSTRSISNSGYGVGSGGSNPFYRGELTELDVLGINARQSITEADISRELERSHRVQIRKGTGLLVLQSGALIPDEPMLKALGPYASIVPFSGVPVSGSERSTTRVNSVTGVALEISGPSATYADMLRLAAARSGASTIICYWGMLESGIENHVTKAVSWTPILGAAIPDQTQHMRIRLKIALIDVRTGDWSVFVPEARVDSTLSAELNRGASDQEQVAALKDSAYKAAADQLMTRYVP